MSETTPRAQLRLYLLRLAAVAFVVAFALTAGLRALLFRGSPTISFLGGASILVDLFVTGQVMPILATLATAWRVRKDLEAGKVPLPSSSRHGRTRRLLPLPLWMRAIVLGIHGILAALAVSVALWLASVDAMSYWPFVLFLGVFGGVLSAYATVLSAHRLIADAAAEHASGAKVHAPSGASTTGIHP